MGWVLSVYWSYLIILKALAKNKTHRASFFRNLSQRVTCRIELENKLNFLKSVISAIFMQMRFVRTLLRYLVNYSKVKNYNIWHIELIDLE